MAFPASSSPFMASLTRVAVEQVGRLSLSAFGRSLKVAASFSLHGTTGLRIAEIPSPASGAAARAIVSGIVVSVTNIPVNRPCLVAHLCRNVFYGRNNHKVTRMIVALSVCT